MWLDIDESTSIVSKKIVAVKAIDQMTTVVYTDLNEFTVNLPKSVVMGMIESRNKGENSMGNTERLLAKIYEGQVTARP